ncbi:TPR Domain containing protein [sediment metagenome]|uniref:TPR Domain containing protein n=1 Tax=sediment metagenome TaxID=749907 RepID=D9PI81_9ZZZZ
MAWKDDYTLFTTDVKTSFNSTFSNEKAGTFILEKAKAEKDPVRREELFRQSIQYLERAAEIDPTQLFALINLGNAHYEYNRNYDKVLYYYSKVFRLNRRFGNAEETFKGIIGTARDPDIRIRGYRMLLEYKPGSFTINLALGELYGRYKNMPDSAIIFMQQALRIDPGHIPTMSNLALMYVNIGRKDKALEVLKKAYRINPADHLIRENLLRLAEDIGDPATINLISRQNQAE